MTSTSRPSLAWFWVTSGVILVADLVSKAVVNRSLELGGPGVNVIGEFFRLRHIRNSGGLFGLFPDKAIYFAAISVIAVAVILWVLHRSQDRSRIRQVALGLVLGGALGNFHDRIRYREVVDFLDVGIGTRRWPTFNVADSGVSVGVVCLILWLYVSERKREKESAGDVGEPCQPETREADRSTGG
jgi:signal peptidase II